jgi:hypothetical protein
LSKTLRRKARIRTAMTAPAPAPLPTWIPYMAFDPLALSTDPEVVAGLKATVLDVREESRILQAGKDLHDRLRRWVSEANKKGLAPGLISPEAVARIPRERASFVPSDRLYLEADRHDQVFNTDPLAMRQTKPGVVFTAATDLQEVIANFDLRPFVDAYVRRLSALMPDHVWRVGTSGTERYYIRTNGFRLNLQAPMRFESRRFPVPKQVVDAFGPMKVIPPPPTCVVCGKQDEKVGLQPDPKRREAHGECLAGAPPAP